MSKIEKIHFFAADSPEANKKHDFYLKNINHHPIEDADVIVVLGGDGTMLEALHFLDDKKFNLPVYGINCGSIGFLLNPNEDNSLLKVINESNPVEIYPLKMSCIDSEGQKKEAIAFNEVSLLRETRQAAQLKITIDNITRLEQLICDGILLSTPAGSTAYNLSANGPILPISANLLSLTPISSFRPRRWQGALLPSESEVQIDVYHSEKRPVSVTADSKEFRDIQSVNIRQSKTVSRTLLFNPEHNLGERIVQEQFTTC
ncbi:MAG: NAD kinase [Pseudomonadota bacterium]